MNPDSCAMGDDVAAPFKMRLDRGRYYMTSAKFRTPSPLLSAFGILIYMFVQKKGPARRKQAELSRNLATFLSLDPVHTV